jgi:hypothetical protein
MENPPRGDGGRFLCAIVNRLAPNLTLSHVEKRGLCLRDNFFDHPLEERRVELEHRLAQALTARKAKGK